MNAQHPLSEQPVTSTTDAKRVICALCQRFFAQGWVSGTGGGVAVRVDDVVCMAPSGVSKELLQVSDIFEINLRSEILNAGREGSKLSQCAPLFLAAMKLRSAGAVIHSHSASAVLATLALCKPSPVAAADGVVVLSELEMLKGLAGVGYHDHHAVPVINNTAHERDLTDALSAAIDAFPSSHAVLVKRHGVYVWGRDWIEAKRHAECYDYLFALVLSALRVGVSL